METSYICLSSQSFDVDREARRDLLLLATPKTKCLVANDEAYSVFCCSVLVIDQNSRRVTDTFVFGRNLQLRTSFERGSDRSISVSIPCISVVP